MRRKKETSCEDLLQAVAEVDQPIFVVYLCNAVKLFQFIEQLLNRQFIHCIAHYMTWYA